MSFALTLAHSWERVACFSKPGEGATRESSFSSVKSFARALLDLEGMDNQRAGATPSPSLAFGELSLSPTGARDDARTITQHSKKCAAASSRGAGASLVTQKEKNAPGLFRGTRRARGERRQVVPRRFPASRRPTSRGAVRSGGLFGCFARSHADEHLAMVSRRTSSPLRTWGSCRLPTYSKQVRRLLRDKRSFLPARHDRHSLCVTLTQAHLSDLSWTALSQKSGYKRNQNRPPGERLGAGGRRLKVGKVGQTLPCLTIARRIEGP